MFDEYIHLYGKMLYGLCRTLCPSSFDADDLYQETWLKAFKKFERYDAQMPFKPWITKICVNTYRDFLRRRRLNPITDAFPDTETKEAALAAVPAKEQEHNSDVRAAVNALPEKLRTTVILFYFHELSEKQTAQALSIPAGTVKSRLNKAKKILKEALQHEYGF